MRTPRNCSYACSYAFRVCSVLELCGKQFGWQGSSWLLKAWQFLERGVISHLPPLHPPCCGHGLFMFSYWILKTNKQKTPNKSFLSNFWSVKKGTETIRKHQWEACKVSLNLRKNAGKNPVIPILLEVQCCTVLGWKSDRYQPSALVWLTRGRGSLAAISTCFPWCAIWDFIQL